MCFSCESFVSNQYNYSLILLLGNEKLEFHIHHVREAARVVKILSLLDSRTGKVTKKAPRCLLAKQSAVVEVC